MLKKQKNSKTKGTVGVGHAIAYFTRIGWLVSIPINDSQSYDLVVDDGTLRTVQVKTTTYKSKYGIWEVDLRTTGGNQSFHTTKTFDHSACDLLYVLVDDGESWLIPTTEFSNGSTLSLGKKYEQYKIRE